MMIYELINVKSLEYIEWMRSWSIPPIPDMSLGAKYVATADE